MLFLDIFGGTEAVCEEVEKRKIEACKAFDGTQVPAVHLRLGPGRLQPG